MVEKSLEATAGGKQDHSKQAECDCEHVLTIEAIDEGNDQDGAKDRRNRNCVDGSKHVALQDGSDQRFCDDSIRSTVDDLHACYGGIGDSRSLEPVGWIR